MTRPEIKVADIMRVAVRTVPSSLPLAEMESQLIAEQVSGFPVVDDNRLVGVVSRSDVVRRICSEREVAERTSDFYYDETGFYEAKMESFKDIADRVGERLEGLLVRDVMVPRLLTAAADEPISDLARRFVEHGVHRFPVTDRGILVGIVTTMDLVRLIADKRLS